MKFFKYTFLVLSALLWMVSCDDILEVEDISGQSVNVLAPTNGSVVSRNMVDFNWQAVSEATGYTVQIATPSFENATQILLDSTIAVDTLGNVRTQIRQTLLNGNYEWRVNAFNSGFGTPYTLNAFSVAGDDNVDVTPPNAPSLVAPTNNVVLTETTVNFSWTRVDVPGTAERDSIYIYTDEALQNLQLKGLGANKSFTTTLQADSYYWVVQAFDAAGNESADSNVFQFTVN
ncbi:fibronectin type III domain-containing protein [Spongiimicrobium salis]|uniref:hypothetical protein n=1 Tax=Spongiimicrobium salis TaxID=1667022 RepID=UPI00374D50C7